MSKSEIVVAPTHSTEVHEGQAMKLETYKWSVKELHRSARKYGGLVLLVEGLAETFGVDLDKTETIPRPLRAIMRALEKRTPFSLRIEIDGEAWRVEVK